MNINSVVLAGNLTKDPDLRETKTGTKVCGMRMATNHKRGKNEETLFMDVTVWGPQAEICERYLKKGRNIAVKGRLKMEEYTDKDDIRRQSVSVVADDVQFGPNASGNNSETPVEATAETATEAVAPF